jgi:hypothetical protein
MNILLMIPFICLSCLSFQKKSVVNLPSIKQKKEVSVYDDKTPLSSFHLFVF